jgi:hypothetical protein
MPNPDTAVTKRENALRNWTVIGVIITAMGVFATIGWDWYKNLSALSLQELASTTIADPTLMPEHLALSYEGAPVANLSKLSFALSNSGHTPILSTQIVESPRIELAPPAKILAFQLGRITPAGVRVTSKLDPQSRSVELNIPLLNPQDRVEFSILVDQASPKYEVAARIAGIGQMQLTRAERRGAFSFRRIPWTAYVVSVAAAFFGLIMVAAIFSLAREAEVRRLWKRNILKIPDSISGNDLKTFLSQLFAGNKTPEEVARVWPIVNGLAGDELVPKVAREQIVGEMDKALNSVRETLQILVACLGMFLACFAYVLVQVFKAFV